MHSSIGNNRGVGIRPLVNHTDGSPALPSDLLNSAALSRAGLPPSPGYATSPLACLFALILPVGSFYLKTPVTNRKGHI